MSNMLFTGTDWEFSDLQRMHDACAEIAIGEMKLDIYRNQLEVISSDQMLDAYSSHGLPIMYPHWSFGKHFARDEALYRKGYQGLAYEIVINSDPCIAYLMEENSAAMQCLVIAHASFGHNHFFKNNYLFKQWTDAGSILDYMAFARKFITECEEKHGVEAVETTLDAAHSLMDQGVFRYKRPRKPNRNEQKIKMERREAAIEADRSELWTTLPKRPNEPIVDFEADPEMKLPEENILYFLEKNAPKLADWQREILRIVRMTSQYFTPQRSTKMMNEGCATFVHHHILNRLFEKGLIGEGAMLELLDVHSAVVYQPSYDSRYYSGINPYALGFAMMQDIQRMATDPTEEDRYWFPHVAGAGDWMAILRDAWANYRDESFVSQFLSPHLIRKMGLFSIMDDRNDPDYWVTHIHNDSGYERVRSNLSQMYDVSLNTPDVQVTAMDQNTRELTLTHFSRYGLKLEPHDGAAVNDHVEKLWGFPVGIDEIELKMPERDPHPLEVI